MGATMQGDGLSSSVERHVAQSHRQRAFDRNSRLKNGSGVEFTRGLGSSR
jgi:hypothetical protein